MSSKGQPTPEVEAKKRRILDSIVDGFVERGDSAVTFTAFVS